MGAHDSGFSGQLFYEQVHENGGRWAHRHSGLGF